MRNDTQAQILLIELEQMRQHARENEESLLAMAQVVGLLAISSAVTALLSIRDVYGLYQITPYASWIVIFLVLGIMWFVAVRVGAVNWANCRAVRIERLLGAKTMITEDEQADRRKKIVSGFPFPLGDDKSNELQYRGTIFHQVTLIMLFSSIAVMIASDTFLTWLFHGPRTVEIQYFPPPPEYWAIGFISLFAWLGSLWLFRHMVRKRVEALPPDLKRVAEDLATDDEDLKKERPLAN